MKTINVNSKDLYQFLIAECRYGYGRNNHLMPDGAYDHVKDYLPLMLEKDEEFAINTAEQLCEECISMQLVNFSDGVDDELHTRGKALEFIEWLINFVRVNSKDPKDREWRPYNYDSYLRNEALDDVPRYNIYEGQYNSLAADASHKLNKEDLIGFLALSTPINKEKLSKNDFLRYLCVDILGQDEVSYRKWDIKFTDDKIRKVTKYVFDDLERIFYIVLEKDNKEE